MKERPGKIGEKGNIVNKNMSDKKILRILTLVGGFLTLAPIGLVILLWMRGVAWVNTVPFLVTMLALVGIGVGILQHVEFGWTINWASRKFMKKIMTDPNNPYPGKKEDLEKYH